MIVDHHRTYERICKAIRGEPLPLAFIDLEALETNIDRLAALAHTSGKTLRIATKSIRCADLLRRIASRGGSAFRGLMAYSPSEARYLVDEGFRDILIAYPTAHPEGARHVAEANRAGAHVSIAVEEILHLEVLERAAAALSVTIPVIVDIDVSLRKLGGRMHLGVRRSPLHDANDVLDFVAAIEGFRHLELAGLLGYEAHIAGIDDRRPLGPVPAGAKRSIKRIAHVAALSLRREIAEGLDAHGIRVPLFNGGGTGSVAFSLSDPSLTEVTVGSGFLGSHLFDHFVEFAPMPAAFFALEITRRPAPGYVTCQGGGFVASGAAGADRLPLPYLPEGLSLLDLEGAGEVQTPLSVPRSLSLELGQPVIFRHAKAGELATFFQEYLLVRGDAIEARALTYRGAGHCFH